MNGDWSWGFGFGHGLFGLLFWIVIIAVVVAVARGFGGRSTRPDTNPALAILKERYARGEIDKDEYERMRHDLEQ